ncbi:alanine--glyoxylate aminotransferase family protein, partial [Candidatus Woesearchaeota archaeon]|nr:alanine--glyoxylate aminotransferase family protein [Candidatus Woesearchaeota archaeon]
MYKKLFIPGPIEVRSDVLKAMSAPLMGHRTNDFKKLMEAIKPKMQQVMMTNNRCLLSTSSGSGFMEATVRNCVGKKVLNTVCGAFSKKWHDIAVRCGKNAERLDVEWGKAIKPEMVDEKLANGDFDSVCVTHNETTTGVLNPLPEIAKVVKNYPDVLLFVDAVSSLGGIKIETDELGLDVCLASTQKALGLPPGFAVASVSDTALKRAETIPGRGYYFD